MSEMPPFFGFTKVGYLQEMCNKYGDFKVAKCWKNADGDLIWSKHRSVMGCWESDEGLNFLAGVNNRSGIDREIRIDIDAGEQNPDEVKRRFDTACDELEARKLEYLGFHSGSRGYHIHLFFSDVSVGKLIKILLIEKSGGELLKVNSSPMLTLEWSPNNKTGKPKLPVRGSAVWVDVDK